MSRTDYDLRKIKAVIFDVDGVLSPSCIPMDDNGMPRRMVNIKDGYAMQLAVKKGLLLAIISGATDESIRHRYNALGINEIHLGASMKLPVLRTIMERYGLQAEEIAYAGDDIPDYEVMAAVGLSVAPSDAAPEICATARYISPADGGHGVARDILEQVLKAQGLWMTCEKAFGW